MKRTTFTFITLLAFGTGAIAAGPAAPKEAVSDPAAPTSAEPAGQPPIAPTEPEQSQQPQSDRQLPGHASGPAPAGAPGKAALSGADQAFIQKAAEMNQYEIEMCKAAARISESPEVRKAAKSMERDLTTARQQLESLAASKGISLPRALPQNLRDQLTAAESRTSSQFDRDYITGQTTIKQESITFFEREGTRTSDPDLKAWAKQIIPGLKNHLSMLKETQPAAVGEKVGDKKKAPAPSSSQ